MKGLRCVVMKRGLLCLTTLLAACHSGGDSPDNSPSVSVGLNQRPDNSDCVAPANPDATTTLRFTPAFAQLPAMASLVGLHQAPNDPAHFYAVLKGGLIQRFDNRADASSFTTVLNLSGLVRDSGESGLLGVAFHPDFASNGYLYVHYSGGVSLTSTVARYTLRGDGQFEPGSAQVLFTQTQPFSNHNGGQIAFGPDGRLYIALGDGGSGGDPQNNGQSTDTLLGKILRIDVNSGSPYSIPSDNPFASGGGRPEIYAYGLRNPWRFSFDRQTGELWAADVGQNAYEEIDVITRGGNYGWRIMEGNHCYGASTCNQTGLVMPVYEYDHSQGCSVSGGFVYRGSAIPSLQGQYLFSDYCSSRIWGFTRGQSTATDYGRVEGNVVSFAEDLSGEIFILNLSGGAGEGIYKIESETTPGSTIPAQLSDTGCVSSTQPTQPSANTIPYAVRAPLWSDGADKSRFLALPNNQSISINADGDWSFPLGSVLIKHFRLQDKLIETRLLMRHNDQWAGYSYEWRDDQTDADLLVTAKDKVINGQTWHYPSGDECFRCHTAAAGNTLGLESAQLNFAWLYPSGTTANQLDTLSHIALFSPAMNASEKQRMYFALDDPNASLTQKARSYLHSNCSQCHRPGGPTPVAIDLRYNTTLMATQTCDMAPQAGDLGLDNARVIAPTDPARSVLLQRMRTLDQNRMPPLASSIPDDAALAVITAWIQSLTTCS